MRILVEGDLTDAKPVKYAGRYAYQRLLDLGIEIYKYQPTMMHTKAIVVDGAWSIFGSANFDNRSLELNDEMNVAVSDPGLAARLLQDFNEDLGARRSWTPAPGAAARRSRRRASTSGATSAKFSKLIAALVRYRDALEPR